MPAGASLGSTGSGPGGATRVSAAAPVALRALRPRHLPGARGRSQDPVRSAQGRAVQSWGPAKVQDAPTASKAACWGPAEPEDVNAGGLQGVTTWVGSLQRPRAGAEQRLLARVGSQRPPSHWSTQRTDPSPAVTSHFFFSWFRVPVPDSVNDLSGVGFS